MAAADIVQSGASGPVVTVWVVPGARRTEIVGLYGETLKIRVAAPPEKGRANKMLGVFLSQQLGSPVRLIAGAGSRRKRYVVPALEREDLVARIVDLLD